MNSNILITFLFILFSSFHCLITQHEIDTNNDLIDWDLTDNHLTKEKPFKLLDNVGPVFKRELKESDTELQKQTSNQVYNLTTNGLINQTTNQATNQLTNSTTNQLINSTTNQTISLDQSENQTLSTESFKNGEKIDRKVFHSQASDPMPPDLNQSTDQHSERVNATEFDEADNFALNNDQHKCLFEIEDNQYLIDGYSNVNNSNRSFLIQEFIKKLRKDRKVTATIRLICLPDTCDERVMLITVDRLVLKYELIKQNIFLDKSAKFYDYLDCFLIQYNPHFGLRGYLNNGMTFDFKKSFINTCFKKNFIVGSIYLTIEFRSFIKEQNMTNVLMISYNSENKEYELRLDQDEKLQTSRNNALINNLKHIYPTYTPDVNQSNDSCDDNTYLSTYDKILNGNLNADNKIQFLNHLNSSIFKSGLHQKPNKFRYLKAHIIFDGGLLQKAEKESLKTLNHLFQVIYESQNHFKQLNMYLVIVRLRFKMPNDLHIYSSTDLKMNITELFDKLKQSDEYFDLPADFKILFTSFKLYHETPTRLIPSYSNENLIGGPDPAIAIEFSALQTNHWLITYEIAHLLGIEDDDESCKCLGGQCVMKRSAKVSELTWSECSIRQLDSNTKAYAFKLDLPVERTAFKPDHFGRPVCGNGVLESNEQCDCGAFGCFFFDQNNQTYRPNRCCNSTTCKLADTSFKCALGSCCDLSTCSLHEPGHVCRSSEDICDIEEKCDGINSFCAEDDFYVNGEFCGMNSICMNKRCVDSKIEFNCRNVFGEDAFESATCWKKNMVANELYNCGYSITDRRWISCRSIQQAKCGSFQCAVYRNSTVSTSLTKLRKSFDVIKTGTDVNRTHECVLIVIKQNLYNSTRSLPFYAPDGTVCSSDDDSLANLKFCSDGECKSNREFSDYENCYAKAHCSNEQRCSQSTRCRCERYAGQDKFNFTAAYYCLRTRSIARNNKPDNRHGLFDRINFYHLLIIPCFVVVLVLASFLRSYLRTGVYKVKNDTSDEMSVSFSGPRPQPYWSKPKL